MKLRRFLKRDSKNIRHSQLYEKSVQFRPFLLLCVVDKLRNNQIFRSAGENVQHWRTRVFHFDGRISGMMGFLKNGKIFFIRSKVKPKTE